MPCCSAMNCSLRTEDGVRLFRLPTDNKKNKSRRKTWLHNCKREDVKNRTIYFCECHFEDTEFEMNRSDGWIKLKQTAVPTKFDVLGPSKHIDAVPRKSIFKKKVHPVDGNLITPKAQNCSDRVYKYGCLLREDSNNVDLWATVEENRKTVRKPVREKKIIKKKAINNDQDEPSTVIGDYTFSCVESVYENFENETEQEKIDRLTKQIEEYERNLHSLRIENQELKEQNQQFQTDMKVKHEAIENECKLYRKSTEELKKKIDDTTSLLNRFLTADQIASLSKQKMKEWSKDTLIKCLKIRFNLGVHGYEYLQTTGYPMPSIRTLSRKLETYDVNLGLIVDLKELLKVKVQCLQPSDRYCCISIDKMQIAESPDYNKVTKKFNGYVSLGDKSELATHFVAVMLRGIKTTWKQVIACATTSNSTKAACMQQFLYQCIDFATECGLTVLSMTSNMENNSVALWTLLGVVAPKNSPVINFFNYKGKKIFITPDVSHLLKNLRSAVQKHGQLVLPATVCQANNLCTPIVSGTYVGQLWDAEIHQEKEHRSLNHLIPEDLNPSNLDRMNVASALRYFSHNTASAIELAITSNILPQEAATTVWFIKLVADWYELSISRYRKVWPTRQNKNIKLELLQKMSDTMNGISIGDETWKPLHRGFLLSTSSLQEITKTLLQEEGIDYLSFNRFTQDALRNLFSQMRNRAGKTPTVSKCLQALKLITVAQYINSTKKGASYLSESDTFLIDVFGKASDNDKLNLKTSANLYDFPEFKEKFPTYSQKQKTIQDLEDLEETSVANYILLSAKGVFYALLDMEMCEECSQFLYSGINLLRSSNYAEYINNRDLDHCHAYTCDGSLMDLILNCEIIYDKYEKFFRKSQYESQLVQKIIRDIKVKFPECKNESCTSLREMSVKLYYDMRESALLLRNYGTFPSYTLQLQDFSDLGFSLKEINFLYEICGSVTDSLLKFRLCLDCKLFLKSNIVANENNCKMYIKRKDLEGLHDCNENMLDLTVNCELIYRHHESLIVKCSNNNQCLIVKIAEDIDVQFPQCKNGCLCLKKKAIELFFNTRSETVKNVGVSKKKKTEMCCSTVTKKKKC